MNSFFYDRFFPIKKSDDKRYRYQTIVGFGGNKGDVRARFKALYHYLSKHRCVSVVQTSPILQNPPFGYLDQDDFFNAVAVIKTSMSPKAFLKFLLHVEKRFKRERSFKNAPRTLDLDIIFFDGKRYSDKRLSIPHPHWYERDSVVLPLASLEGYKKRIR